MVHILGSFNNLLIVIKINLFIPVQDYGIDWQGPVPDEVESRSVEVPDTFCPINESQLSSLKNISRDSSDTYAIKFYSEILSEVEKLVQQGDVTMLKC